MTVLRIDRKAAIQSISSLSKVYATTSPVKNSTRLNVEVMFFFSTATHADTVVVTIGIVVKTTQLFQAVDTVTGFWQMTIVVSHSYPPPR
jgi:hypothetical protein